MPTATERSEIGTPPGDGYLWPDQDDTRAAFEYLPEGIVQVRTELSEATRVKAENLYELIGLGRRPTNDSQARDLRWRKRREAWGQAINAKRRFEDGAEIGWGSPACSGNRLLVDMDDRVFRSPRGAGTTREQLSRDETTGWIGFVPRARTPLDRERQDLRPRRGPRPLRGPFHGLSGGRAGFESGLSGRRNTAQQTTRRLSRSAANESRWSRQTNERVPASCS